MKKLLCVLLAMLMVMGQMSLTAFAETPEGTEAETEATEETVYPDELIVGSVTKMKGDFFTEMFGNDTADIDVRALMHGYNLVNWDQAQGRYIFDPSVVTDVLVAVDDVGNKTYTLATILRGGKICSALQSSINFLSMKRITFSRRNDFFSVQSPTNFFSTRRAAVNRRDFFSVQSPAKFFSTSRAAVNSCKFFSVQSLTKFFNTRRTAFSRNTAANSRNFFSVQSPEKFFSTGRAAFDENATASRRHIFSVQNPANFLGT